MSSPPHRYRPNCSANSPSKQRASVIAKLRQILSLLYLFFFLPPPPSLLQMTQLTTRRTVRTNGGCLGASLLVRCKQQWRQSFLQLKNTDCPLPNPAFRIMLTAVRRNSYVMMSRTPARTRSHTRTHALAHIPRRPYVRTFMVEGKFDMYDTCCSGFGPEPASNERGLAWITAGATNECNQCTNQQCATNKYRTGSCSISQGQHWTYVI